MKIPFKLPKISFKPPQNLAKELLRIQYIWLFVLGACCIIKFDMTNFLLCAIGWTLCFGIRAIIDAIGKVKR